MPLLCSLDTLKIYSPQDGTRIDALSELLLKAASRRISNYCSCDFDGDAAFTEVMHGRGTNILIPKKWPINSIASASVNGSVLTTAPTFDDDFIYLPQPVCRGVGNISVTYSGGYLTTDDVDPELQLACAMLTALMIQERSRVGISTRTLATETITYSNKEMPDQIAQKLSDFRRPMIAL